MNALENTKILDLSEKQTISLATFLPFILWYGSDKS